MCGAPSETHEVVFTFNGSERVVQVWRYERTGLLPRVLRFENDQLVALSAVGPLRGSTQ
jgi:hypothetical protein